jgi:hypothetical protein
VWAELEDEKICDNRHLRGFSSLNHQAVEMMQNKKCHSEENLRYKSIINSDCCLAEYSTIYDDQMNFH